MLADAEKCPNCNAPLVERYSRFGKFFGCSRHPECKYIKKKGGDKGRKRLRKLPSTCAPNAVSRCCNAWVNGDRSWVAAATPNAKPR